MKNINESIKKRSIHNRKQLSNFLWNELTALNHRNESKICKETITVFGKKFEFIVDHAPLAQQERNVTMPKDEN